MLSMLTFHHSLGTLRYDSNHIANPIVPQGFTLLLEVSSQILSMIIFKY